MGEAAQIDKEFNRYLMDKLYELMLFYARWWWPNVKLQDAG